MASLERRLQYLEEVFARSPGEASGAGGGGGSGLTREFVSGVLRAMGYIRREPIDSPPWRYRTNMLRDFDPFTLGQYTAALAVLEHPDEDEARQLLEGQDEGGLVRLVDNVVDHVKGVLRGT